MGLIREHGLNLHKHPLTFWQVAPTPATVQMPKSQLSRQPPVPSSPTPCYPRQSFSQGWRGSWGEGLSQVGRTLHGIWRLKFHNVIMRAETSELKSFLPSETGKERLHPPFPTPPLPPRLEEAFLHCCCCGVIFIQTLGKRAGFFSLSCPLSPVLFLRYPLAKGPFWCCRFGAGCLTNSVHRWEISGTTWQIQRTLLEAAGVIQIFIHLLCMEYKEDESTDTWFLRSVWKNHILSLFPIVELLFPPEKLN